MKLKKLTIGVRPQVTIFRVSSLGGLIADKILDSRNTKNLTEDYFTLVQRSPEIGTINLTDKDQTHNLLIGQNDINFTKDYYDTNNSIDVKEFIKEFHYLYGIVNEILKLNDVRRIGLAGEYRFEVKDITASEFLIRNITGFDTNIPAKFNLRFEDRYPSNDKEKFDIKTSEFINVIHDYYDSVIDQHKEEGHINCNIDVQYYYAPPIKSVTTGELNKIINKYKEEEKKINSYLKEKGLI